MAWLGPGLVYQAVQQEGLGVPSWYGCTKFPTLGSRLELYTGIPYHHNLGWEEAPWPLDVGSFDHSLAVKSFLAIHFLIGHKEKDHLTHLH